MQNATPPIEALPLLALIAQFNYSEEKHAQDFYDHLPRYAYTCRVIHPSQLDVCLPFSLAVKHIYREGDKVPYVRILYTKLPEEKRSTKAAPEDPHPIMIVSFTGSTRKMDWVDDLVCRTPPFNVSS